MHLVTLPSTEASARLEQHFWKWWWHSGLSRWDRLTAFLVGPCSLLLTPALTHLLKVRPVPLLLVSLCNMEKLVVCTRLHFNAHTYLRWRSFYIAAGRVLGLLIVAYIGTQVTVVERSGADSGKDIVEGGSGAYSHILAFVYLAVLLVCQPFGSMAPFRVHLAWQTVAFLAAVASGARLCQGSREEPRTNDLFVKCEDWLNRLLPMLVGLPPHTNASDQVVCACGMVSTFGLFWLGLVVPTVISYVMESRARCQFVRERMGIEARRAREDDDRNQKSALSLRALLWCFNCVLGLYISWRVLKRAASQVLYPFMD